MMSYIFRLGTMKCLKLIYRYIIPEINRRFLLIPDSHRRRNLNKNCSFGSQLVNRAGNQDPRMLDRTALESSTDHDVYYQEKCKIAADKSPRMLLYVIEWNKKSCWTFRACYSVLICVWCFAIGTWTLSTFFVTTP